MTPKTRIGVIGAGGMGRVHANAYANHPDCELVAICDTNKNIVERMMKGDWPRVDYGDELVSFTNPICIPNSFETLELMAKADNIDAVSVCLPNKFHAPAAIELLKNGKHVLVEKPMAGSVAECNEMIAIAKEKNLILQVGHMWRFHSDINMIRNVIQSGLIGDIVKIKGYGIHTNWGPDGWFVDPDLAIGGALIDMGVHAIDTINYCINDSPPKRVYAKVETRYGDYKVDDSGIVMVTYENGAHGIIESGWSNPYADGGEAACQFFGTKGYARLFPTEVHYDLGGKWGRFLPDRKPGDLTLDEEYVELYTRQIRSFVSAIRGEKPCEIPGEVGKKVMQVIEAAYRSTRENTTVDVAQ